MEKKLIDVVTRAFTLLIVKGVITQEEMDAGGKEDYEHLCDLLEKKAREHLESQKSKGE